MIDGRSLDDIWQGGTVVIENVLSLESASVFIEAMDFVRRTLYNVRTTSSASVPTVTGGPPDVTGPIKNPKGWLKKMGIATTIADLQRQKDSLFEKHLHFHTFQTGLTLNEDLWKNDKKAIRNRKDKAPSALITERARTWPNSTVFGNTLNAHKAKSFTGATYDDDDDDDGDGVGLERKLLGIAELRDTKTRLSRIRGACPVFPNTTETPPLNRGIRLKDCYQWNKKLRATIRDWFFFWVEQTATANNGAGGGGGDGGKRDAFAADTVRRLKEWSGDCGSIELCTRITLDLQSSLCALYKTVHVPPHESGSVALGAAVGRYRIEVLDPESWRSTRNPKAWSVDTVQSHPSYHPFPSGRICSVEEMVTSLSAVDGDGGAGGSLANRRGSKSSTFYGFVKEYNAIHRPSKSTSARYATYGRNQRCCFVATAAANTQDGGGSERKVLGSSVFEFSMMPYAAYSSIVGPGKSIPKVGEYFSAKANARGSSLPTLSLADFPTNQCCFRLISVEIARDVIRNSTRSYEMELRRALILGPLRYFRLGPKDLHVEYFVQSRVFTGRYGDYVNRLCLAPLVERSSFYRYYGSCCYGKDSYFDTLDTNENLKLLRTCLYWPAWKTMKWMHRFLDFKEVEKHHRDITSDSTNAAGRALFGEEFIENCISPQARESLKDSSRLHRDAVALEYVFYALLKTYQICMLIRKSLWERFVRDRNAYALRRLFKCRADSYDEGIREEKMPFVFASGPGNRGCDGPRESGNSGGAGGGNYFETYEEFEFVGKLNGLHGYDFEKNLLWHMHVVLIYLSILSPTTTTTTTTTTLGGKFRPRFVDAGGDADTFGRLHFGHFRSYATSNLVYLSRLCALRRSDGFLGEAGARPGVLKYDKSFLDYYSDKLATDLDFKTNVFPTEFSRLSVTTANGYPHCYKPRHADGTETTLYLKTPILYAPFKMDTTFTVGRETVTDAKEAEEEEEEPVEAVEEMVVEKENEQREEEEGNDEDDYGYNTMMDLSSYYRRDYVEDVTSSFALPQVALEYLNYEGSSLVSEKTLSGKEIKNAMDPSSTDLDIFGSDSDNAAEHLVFVQPPTAPLFVDGTRITSVVWRSADGRSNNPGDYKDGDPYLTNPPDVDLCDILHVSILHWSAWYNMAGKPKAGRTVLSSSRDSMATTTTTKRWLPVEMVDMELESVVTFHTDVGSSLGKDKLEDKTTPNIRTEEELAMPCFKMLLSIIRRVASDCAQMDRPALDDSLEKRGWYEPNRLLLNPKRRLPLHSLEQIRTLLFDAKNRDPYTDHIIETGLPPEGKGNGNGRVDDPKRDFHGNNGSMEYLGACISACEKLLDGALGILRRTLTPSFSATQRLKNGSDVSDEASDLPSQTSPLASGFLYPTLSYKYESEKGGGDVAVDGEDVAKYLEFTERIMDALTPVRIYDISHKSAVRESLFKVDEVFLASSEGRQHLDNLRSIVGWNLFYFRYCLGIGGGRNGETYGDDAYHGLDDDGDEGMDFLLRDNDVVTDKVFSDYANYDRGTRKTVRPPGSPSGLGGGGGGEETESSAEDALLSISAEEYEMCSFRSVRYGEPYPFNVTSYAAPLLKPSTPSQPPPPPSPEKARPVTPVQRTVSRSKTPSPAKPLQVITIPDAVKRGEEGGGDVDITPVIPEPEPEPRRGPNDIPFDDEDFEWLAVPEEGPEQSPPPTLRSKQKQQQKQQQRRRRRSPRKQLLDQRPHKRHRVMREGVKEVMEALGEKKRQEEEGLKEAIAGLSERQKQEYENQKEVLEVELSEAEDALKAWLQEKERRLGMGEDESYMETKDRHLKYTVNVAKDNLGKLQRAYDRLG